MTEAIAILGLCISILVLIVQYINQLERRHGEIAHLRSDLITRLLLSQQRVSSFRMHVETARIELRSVRDSEDKYESIEAMPKLIADTREVEEKIRNLIRRLESIDTAKKNTNKTLLILQASQHDAKMVEEVIDAIEKKMLDLMEAIREQQRLPARKTKKKQSPT